MSGQNAGQAGYWQQADADAIDRSSLAYQPGVFDVSALPKFDPIPGVTMSVLAGSGTMANWVKIAPGGEVPLHAHPHEQLGLVLEGQITMNIGGEAHVIKPGQCYRIPGTLPHSGLAGPEGCLVVDIFAPLREDYVAAAK